MARLLLLPLLLVLLPPPLLRLAVVFCLPPCSDCSRSVYVKIIMVVAEDCEDMHLADAGGFQAAM
jgi:hypothetical protein